MQSSSLAAAVRVTFLLMTGPISAAEAQIRPDFDAIAADVRTVVQSLRERATRHDWEAMAPHFSNTLGSVVEPVVTTSVPPGTVSFWLPEAEVSLDSLAIQLVARDIAAVRVNFRVRGSLGTWGAVLIMKSGTWVIHCLGEYYPGSADRIARLLPGCVVRQANTPNHQLRDGQ